MITSHGLYDFTFYIAQIIVSLVGMYYTLKIYKLLNHGNFWWMMSAGFFLFILATISRMFIPHSNSWYGDWNVLYIPLAIRLAFVISIHRIYTRAMAEHEEKLDALSHKNEILEKLRILTESHTMGCPHWSVTDGCQNPINPNSTNYKK
jgi:hypothetical protein